MSILRLAKVAAIVNVDLVSNLEDMLEMARSGELASLHGCGTMRDGSVTTWTSSTDNMLLELAAVDRLHHRMHKMADRE
jgi:hypothetical protein